MKDFKSLYCHVSAEKVRTLLRSLFTLLARSSHAALRFFHIHRTILHYAWTCLASTPDSNDALGSVGAICRLDLFHQVCALLCCTTTINWRCDILPLPIFTWYGSMYSKYTVMISCWRVNRGGQQPIWESHFWKLCFDSCMNLPFNLRMTKF